MNTSAATVSAIPSEEKLVAIVQAFGTYFASCELQKRGFAVEFHVDNPNERGTVATIASKNTTTSVRILSAVRAERCYKRRPEFNHFEWQIRPEIHVSEENISFYILIDLQFQRDKSANPVAYIIPRAFVDKRIPADWESPVIWLSEIEAPEYLEKWSLIQ